MRHRLRRIGGEVIAITGASSGRYIRARLNRGPTRVGFPLAGAVAALLGRAGALGHRG